MQGENEAVFSFFCGLGKSWVTVKKRIASSKVVQILIGMQVGLSPCRFSGQAGRLCGDTETLCRIWPEKTVKQEVLWKDWSPWNVWWTIVRMVTLKVNSSLLFFFLLFVCVRRRGHKLHGLLLRIGRMDGVNTEIKKNSYFCDCRHPWRWASGPWPSSAPFRMASTATIPRW